MILSTFTKVASHGLRGAATKQSFRKWRFLSFLDSPLRSCVGYLSLSPRAFGESRPWGPVCPCNLRASPILFQHSYILCVSGRASITLPVAFYRKFHIKSGWAISSDCFNLLLVCFKCHFTKYEGDAACWQHKFHNALAAMTLAFFGFLRIGELSCYLTFDPKYNLMKRDITFMPRCSPKYMLVHLKVSNIDPFRLGQSIDIGKTNLSLQLSRTTLPVLHTTCIIDQTAWE